jgi:hypothetical protein
MLAYLLGSCLLFAGLINQLSRSRSLQIIFLALFAATSVGFQYNQMQDYKKLSDYQRNFLWQLTWRAPDLEPGTALLSNGLPYQDYLSGNAITTQVQWTYSQKQVAATRALDYMFIFINSPQLGAIEEMSPNHEINYDFRTYQFHGSTNQTLLVGGNGSNCLRVLDDNLTPVQAFVDLYPKRMLDAANISNLDTILADANTKKPPKLLFGSEPRHTWCYYFEKAELARQVKDYTQAYNLIKDGNQLGFFPKDLTEWYPFIDSALHLGYFYEAVELSNKIIQNDSVVKYGVCHTWENYAGSLAAGDPIRENVRAQLSLMECP